LPQASPPWAPVSSPPVALVPPNVQMSLLTGTTNLGAGNNGNFNIGVVNDGSGNRGALNGGISNGNVNR
jgi:hypothetical protein